MSEFFDKPQRRTRVVLIVVGAVVVLAIGITIGIVAVGGSDGADRAETTPGSAPSSSTGVDESLTSMTIVEGGDTVDGVGIKFPHSTVGAVSAAVEYWSQIGSTFDPKHAVAVGEALVDPEMGATEDDFAKAAANNRKFAGLPADGGVPEGDSIVLAPVAYQLREEVTDEMTVLLLGYYTYTPAGGEAKEQIGVYPSRARWDGDDWKLSQVDEDYSDLIVTPGSEKARAKGWREITR